MPELTELERRALARSALDSGMKAMMDIHWTTRDWSDGQKFEYMDKWMDEQPTWEGEMADGFREFADWLARLP